MKKIKILFAVGRLTIGGGEKLLVHQLKYLDREKFDPHLLTLFPEKKESFEPLLRSDLQLGVRPLDMVWKQFNFHGIFDAVSWFHLVRYLRREKFDVIVTSLFSANLNVRLASLLAGRPKVMIAYEHNIYSNKHRWQIWVDWFLAKFTDRVIVDAESVKKFTAKQEGIPEDKFLVMHIPPLADVKVGPPAGGPTLDELRNEFWIKPDDMVILTVSRLVKEKGHTYLIQAAKVVCSQFPNAKFLIVGWGPLKEKLEEEVRALGLEGKVIVAGKRDIADVLPLADMYVEPALSVDIGIASMEAMRAGLPIVSTDVGEMPVFVKDRENGFLVPPGDSGALAEKILVILKSDALRKKMGEKSRERVKDFTVDGYMRKFEGLIEAILDAN